MSLMKLTGGLFSQNTNPYRPLIHYNWGTKLSQDGSRVLVDSGSSPKYDGKLMFGKGVKPNGTDQSFPINCIGATTLYVFKDGVLTTEDVTAIDTYTADEEVVYSNAITTSKAFTDSQVDYLSKYPEKFLYHEKTVNADGSATWEAKSKILTQDEIDSVVAHLPMCEADGYVRDMIEYSESVDEIINGTFDTTSNWSINQGWAIADGVASCDGTADSYIRQYGAIEPFEMYIVEFDITAYTSGGLRVYLGEYLFIQNITGIGKKSFVGLSGDVSDHLRIHTDDFVGSIDNVTSQKLTSTYQIANYTNAVRDEAMNLTYGLQTCFLERDELGVITGGSFDRLNCDGVGYADTGWIPPSSGSYQIEAIFYNNSNDVVQDCGADVDFFRLYSNGKIYYSFHGTFMSSFVMPIGFFHMVVNVANDDYELFNNGISYDVGTNSNVTSTTSFILSENYAGNLANPMVSPIPLFKIHTTPQDPLELYNKAVKKGLLQ